MASFLRTVHGIVVNVLPNVSHLGEVRQGVIELPNGISNGGDTLGNKFCRPPETAKGDDQKLQVRPPTKDKYLIFRLGGSQATSLQCHYEACFIAERFSPFEDGGICRTGHRKTTLKLAQSRNRRGRREKEPLRMERERPKAEVRVEVGRALVLSLHYDRENGD